MKSYIFWTLLRMIQRFCWTVMFLVQKRVTVQNVVFSYTDMYEKMRDLGWVFLLYINRAGKITPLNSILENCWWNVLLHGPNFLLPTICKKIIIIIPNQHNTQPLNLSLFTCICIKINDTLLQWFGCFKKLIFAFPQ